MLSLFHDKIAKADALDIPGDYCLEFLYGLLVTVIYIPNNSIRVHLADSPRVARKSDVPQEAEA